MGNNSQRRRSSTGSTGMSSGTSQATVQVVAEGLRCQVAWEKGKMG